MKKLLSASLLLLAVLGNIMVSSSAKAVPTSTLSVTVSGLKNQRGQVCLSLFASGKGFPGSKGAVQTQCIKATATTLVVEFPNFKFGNYAVAVFHDTNGSGILHRNFLGIPTEEFGFSQNPTILTGAPKFEDAAVFVAGPQTKIEIQLQTFLGG